MTETESSLNKTFHTWRYYTTRLLYVDHGRHSSAQRLEDLLREDLKEFLYTSGQDHSVINEALKALAEAVVYFDFWVESTKFQVQLVFDDEETGKIFGFPLPTSKESSAKPQMTSLNPHRACGGSQVDLMVEPIFRVYGKLGLMGDLCAPKMHSSEHDVNRYDVCSFLSPAEVSSANYDIVEGI
jgi:hypothetical protein